MTKNPEMWRVEFLTSIVRSPPMNQSTPMKVIAEMIAEKAPIANSTGDSTLRRRSSNVHEGPGWFVGRRPQPPLPFLPASMRGQAWQADAFPDRRFKS